MVMDVSPGEGWLHGAVDALESHKVSTDNAETMQLWQVWWRG